MANKKTNEKELKADSKSKTKTEPKAQAKTTKTEPKAQAKTTKTEPKTQAKTSKSGSNSKLIKIISIIVAAVLIVSAIIVAVVLIPKKDKKEPTTPTTPAAPTTPTTPSTPSTPSTPTTPTTPVEDPVVLKVLSIGDELVDDSTTYLYDIAKSLEVGRVNFANLILEDADIDTHLDNLTNDNADYVYTEKETKADGTLATKTIMAYDMETALNAEEWDYIVLSQGYNDADDSIAYEYIQEYIDAVEEICPDAKIVWNMTWSAGATQDTMYEDIAQIAEEDIDTMADVDAVIPTGTAIQNLRQTYLKDKANKITDGTENLTGGVDSYVVSMCYAKALGMDVTKLAYCPTTVSAQEQQVAYEAVRQAYKQAYKASFTNFDVEPAKEGYIQIDVRMRDIGYYNSTDTAGDYYNGTIASVSGGNSINYYMTEKFDKTDLINGTIITLKSGYNYRPEGWVNAQRNGQNGLPGRPNTTTAAEVVVDAAWWGQFTERGFNIQKTGTGNFPAQPDSVIVGVYAALKIYVPVATA